MIRLMRLLINPVFGTPEQRWIVRQQRLIEVRADSESFILIIASRLTHHNRLARRFGQVCWPPLQQGSQIRRCGPVVRQPKARGRSHLQIGLVAPDNARGTVSRRNPHQRAHPRPILNDPDERNNDRPRSRPFIEVRLRVVLGPAAAARQGSPASCRPAVGRADGL
jgi:hypothetical protein